MNTEPKKTTPAIDKQLSEALKATPSRFWKRLTHNWGWKLLSLFLAICLWAGLITQDPNLTRERRFTDVNITLTGEDTLLRNGMIVLSGLEDENLQLESFRAQIPQRSYDSASVSNYNPRIDLSRITETGEQDVKVLFTTSSTYGTVESATPDTFRITVDEYVTNYRVPVTLNVVGEYPEGYYAAQPIVEPSTLAVSGPKSLVDQVVAVQADYNLSSLAARSGTTKLALPLKFISADGSVMESSLLRAANANTVLRTITVEQRLYAQKTLDVSTLALTTGQPAEGYQVKSITATPTTLLAAGDEELLASIESLFAETPISIEGATETFTAELRLRKPSELTYLSNTAVTVCVEIVPIITSRSFENVRVQVENLPEDFRSVLSLKNLDVTVTGPMLAVKALRASQVRAYVDASGLGEGSHIAQVLLGSDSDDAHLFTMTADPATITLTLE